MHFLSHMHWRFLNNQLYFSYMGHILLNLFAGLQLWPHKFREVSTGHIHSTLSLLFSQTFSFFATTLANYACVVFM